MTLDRFRKVIPPPPVLSRMPHDDDWKGVALELGVEFPDEFKQFCANYGVGTFRGTEATELSIYCPHPGFVRNIREECQRFRDIRGSEKSDDFPYDVFPDKGGLLPLGADECDTWLCWATTGDAREWSIVVRWTFGPTGMKTFNMPLSDFLIGVFERTIELPCWPEPWFVDDVEFVPYTGEF